MTQVQPALQSTYAMIKAAFPEGIAGPVYDPLLAVLNETMSFHQVAEVVAYFTGADTALILHDAIRVAGLDLEQEKAGIIRRLEPFGYRDWLNEE